MQKEYSLKQFFIRNNYLLVTAAWLVTISFIIDNYLTGNSSQKTVAKNINHFIAKQENDFDAVTADTLLLTRLAGSTYTEKELKELTRKKYFFYLYDKNAMGNHNLLFWSTQVVQPMSALSIMQGKTGFVQLSNGYYVWRKAVFNDLTAIALIPIRWNYSITNDYLKNNFTIGENIESAYSINLAEGGTPILSREGAFLFSLEPKLVNVSDHNNLVASIFKIVAALFILIFVQFAATRLVQKSFFRGTAFLVLVLLVLRIISYNFDIPVNFRQFELFDPRVYGSNVILKTLGDLLINAMLFLWIVLFVRFYIQEKKVGIRVKQVAFKWLIVLTGLCFLIFCTFLCGHIFRSMVADSKISFDVINFDTLNLYSVIGFVVLGCIAIGYFFVTQIVIYLLQPLLPRNIMVLILVLTITGLVVLSFRVNTQDSIFELYLLIWLLVYLLLLNNKHLFLLASAIISSRLIFWLFFFSLSIDLIILNENNKKRN